MSAELGAGQAPGPDSEVVPDSSVSAEQPPEAVPHTAEELGRLVAQEQSAPHSADFVQGVISALASLPPGEAVPLLVRLAEQRSGLTADSLPSARAAIRALGSVPGELAPPALHRLASESPQAALRKAAYAALKRRLSTLSTAPEWTVPAFGLDAHSRVRVTVGPRHVAVVEVTAEGRVEVGYRDASGRTLAGKPTASTLDATAMAGVAELADDLRKAVRAAKTRLESAQKERREIPTADWHEHYLAHPVTGRLARTLLWELREGDDRRIGLPRLIEKKWSLVTVSGERLVPGDDAVLSVAVAGSLTGEEAGAWARALRKARVQPVLPQIPLS